jgi:hypothetical protein
MQGDDAVVGENPLAEKEQVVSTTERLTRAEVDQARADVQSGNLSWI